jgi:hypothetical protein
VAAELAVTALARGALAFPSRRPAKSKALAAERGSGDLPEGSIAVSETVVLRRLIFRR